MKKNILFPIIKQSILIIFFLLFADKIHSQDFSEHIENSVSTLTKKLLLNQDQIKSITHILEDFFQSKKDGKEVDSLAIIYEANNRIEAFLDKKQRIKYDVIKSDWWNKLLERKNSYQTQDSL